MKIKVLQENLKIALTYLQKAVPSKPQLPILSSILIQTTKDGLMLSATDLYFGVRCFTQAKVEKEGTIAVPGEIFKQLITSLPAGELEMSAEDINVIVKAGKSVTKLPIQNGADFPQFPDVEGENISLTIEEINMIERNVSFAISLDQTRPVLTAVLFRFTPEKLAVVGTDGFRLAILDVAAKQSQESWQMLLPARAVNEMVRIANQLKVTEVSFLVSSELKQAKITVGDTELFVRLIEGEYPPYEKIVPTSFLSEVLLDSEELLSQLKRAAFFARDTSNIVRFKLAGSEAVITAKSPAYGEYVGSMDVRGNLSQPVEIAFNIFYVIDFLNNTKAEQTKLQVNESLRPAQLSIDGINHYKYIVMPFRTNETG